MAASSGNISKALTIVWKTERAYEGRPRRSSKFSIIGETWYLEMESDVNAYNYESNCSLPGCYAIYLLRDGNRQSSLPFSVTTHIETNARRKGCRLQGLMATYDPKLYMAIWIYKMEFISEQIPGFGDSTELTVVCTIGGVDPSMCRIADETIDVTTQTDFDRRLPVRSLYDNELPSNENDQAASWVSSNLDSLSHDLGKLLEDKVLPDVKLRCGDRTVAAHKAVLAARSEVFGAMFQSKMLENETGVVDITDVDVKALEWFLKYVYTGRLFELSDDDLPNLYATSDKYAVFDLKKACSERMINHISEENYLNFLSLADSHNDQDIKSAIVDFILNHIELLKSQKWTKFRKENSSLCSDFLQVILEKQNFG